MTQDTLMRDKIWDKSWWSHQIVSLVLASLLTSVVRSEISCWWLVKTEGHHSILLPTNLTFLKYFLKYELVVTKRFDHCWLFFLCVRSLWCVDISMLLLSRVHCFLSWDHWSGDISLFTTFFVTNHLHFIFLYYSCQWIIGALACKAIVNFAGTVL